jgi:hypothetical protein
MVHEIEAAVRAYVSPTPLADKSTWVDRGPSRWTLVFDTETLTDLSQRLRILAYQIRERDRLDETGLAYDPDALTESEFESLSMYAQEHGRVLLTNREFVTEVFEPVALRLRGLVVGHNLGFDISRIASGHGRIAAGHDRPEHGPATRVDRSMLGGVSFALPGTALRVQVKRTSARGSFVRLALPGGYSAEHRNRDLGGNAPDHRGYFVDTATLGGALLGGKLKLERLAELLATAHQKTAVELSSPIGPELLAYAENDVQVTWECFVDLRERASAFGLSRTPIWRIHSEASIAKGLVREMGIAPWRRVQPDFDPGLVATVMETYYGGRVGCGIRATPVPGMLLDFTSQYPTVSALMELWPYHVAGGIEATEEDPAAVQTWLEQLTVGDILNPATWPTLQAIVLVDPFGARMPTRAKYGRESKRDRRRKAKNRNVALPIRADHQAQWWTLADAAASVLETGQAPRVLRVLRFRPREPQADLQPIDIAGDPAYRVDPYTDDVIRRLVELRAMLRTDAARARAAGDERGSKQLRARAGALKKSANSLAYGVPIEVNVTDFAKSIPVNVVRPDGSTFRAVGASRAEEPGEFFNPLLATLVVAGGRLLLATAMRLVRDAGGTYAYWDTDGLFVVATESGGQVVPRGLAADAGVAPVPALTRKAVRAIADRFASLNPYEPGLVRGSILNVVPVAFDPETGVEREIWCLSLAAKRYCLFTLGADGRPSVARTTDDAYRSEHALGHLMAPDKALGSGVWVSRWWEHLVCLELKLDDPEPEWLNDPAFSPLTINSAADERPFRAFNSSRPYPLQVRPGGFAMVAHVRSLSSTKGSPRVLVAPREDDRAKRAELVWFDRADATGTPYRVRTGDSSFVIPGVPTVQSYRDCFEEFRRHPEEKELGPDGEPCAPWTRGQLQPSTVAVVSIVRLGKEASRLVNTDSSEAVEFGAAEYRQSACAGCGVPIPPDRRWCSEACRKRAGRARERVAQVCRCCGEPLQRGGGRLWCSDACRKRSSRAGDRRLVPEADSGAVGLPANA